MKKVWFITGASQGLGLVLAQQLLQANYRVAATTRDKAALEQAVGTYDSESFLALALDITDDAAVKQAMEATVAHFGRVDVLVNNAGYGLLGALEELSETEVHRNFDVNVYGLLHVIRHGLPYLRTQGSGHIFNIASVGGFTGKFPGFGVYCATKFAVQGLSEALYEEVKPFGVHTTVVSPGYFRTNFLAESSLHVAKHELAAYDNVRQTQQLHREIDGQQPGDPQKAAAAVIKIAEHPEPPLHLFLGADAYQYAKQKMNDLQQEMRSFEEMATATNFDSVVER